MQNPDISGIYDICFSNNVKVKQRQFYIIFSRFWKKGNYRSISKILWELSNRSLSLCHPSCHYHNHYASKAEKVKYLVPTLLIFYLVGMSLLFLQLTFCLSTIHFKLQFFCKYIVGAYIIWALICSIICMYLVSRYISNKCSFISFVFV